MKNQLITTLTFLGFIFSTSLSAQFAIGANVGYTFNSVSVKDLGTIVGDLPKATNDFLMGISSAYLINDQMSITSEINYVKKGFTVNEGTNFTYAHINIPVGAAIETSLKYIHIPLLFKYKFGNNKIKPFIEIGPSLSYATSGEIKTSITAIINLTVNTTAIDFDNDRFNRTLIDGNFGAGIDIPLGPGYFTAAVRYTPSFTNLLNNTNIDGTIKNNSLGLQIAYLYKI